MKAASAEPARKDRQSGRYSGLEFPRPGQFSSEMCISRIRFFRPISISRDTLGGENLSADATSKEKPRNKKPALNEFSAGAGEAGADSPPAFNGEWIRVE
jgi:hypothetical protein